MIEKIQTDDSNYQRDINSKALLNNNTNQYSIYQQRKRIAEEQNKKHQYKWVSNNQDKVNKVKLRYYHKYKEYHKVCKEFRNIDLF